MEKRLKRNNIDDEHRIMWKDDDLEYSGGIKLTSLLSTIWSSVF